VRKFSAPAEPWAEQGGAAAHARRSATSTPESEQMRRAITVLDLNQLKLQYITNKTGEKTAVILPIEAFQELLEDIEDLAAVAERREEPTIPHDELVAELKRDGLL
jgi:hypothetical protein